jgi:hypothetical protein
MNRAAVVAAAALAVLTGPSAQAQWEKVSDPAVMHRGSDEPDMAARAPRVGRRPDLSGNWLADSEPLPEGMPVVEIDLTLPRHFISVVADLAPEEVPLQQWAAELFEQRLASEGVDDPVAHCKPSGMPLLAAAPLPFKIVQTRNLVVILYEENTVFRQIFLDGRRPVEDAQPRYMGYSTGRWDGDTLVVDTVGFSDFHWLDAMGHPLTEQMHLTERFRRPDAGHLEVTLTIDDPGAYTAPITYTIKNTLMPDDDLLEYFCAENEKDVQHYQ